MTRIDLAGPRRPDPATPLSFVPRVVLLTAMHGRHEIAKRMLSHSLAVGQQLAPMCSFRPMVVMSPGDVSAMGPWLDKRGISWMETANRPLSNKWQRGVTALSEAPHDIDLLMLAGSDDFLSYAYARWAIRLAASGQSSACGPDWVYLYNAETGQMARYTGPSVLQNGFPAPVGAGRVFAQSLLVRTGWKLWPREANATLDGMCTQWLANLGYTFNTLCLDARPGAGIVDVKDGENIHGWERFQNALIYPPADADALLRQWGLFDAVKGDR